jgi:hypothetical protein
LSAGNTSQLGNASKAGNLFQLGNASQLVNTSQKGNALHMGKPSQKYVAFFGKSFLIEIQPFWKSLYFSRKIFTSGPEGTESLILNLYTVFLTYLIKILPRKLIYKI